MLSLAAPAWLLGLLLLPAIRWLHRGGRHRRALPVARLALWHGTTASPPAAGQRQPPDPAWRRRALLAALFFVALAEPRWPSQHLPVTLWVDDATSMRTREAAGTRLALGLAQARLLLADTAPAAFEWRTLGDPWRRLDDAAIVSLLAGAAGGRAAGAPGTPGTSGQPGPPGPPPAALLQHDRQHWLITDGAHASRLDWPDGRRPDRTIQVGTVARNVGLERLSARRNRHDPGQVDLLLRITNGGSAEETRELVLTTEAGAALARTRLRLAPGASVDERLVVPATNRVLARLQPGDALAEDDEITLDLAALRRLRIAVDPGCAQALAAAVAAHPALQPVAANAADVAAVLDCGTRALASGVATLRVLADRVPAPLPGPLQWSTSVAESARPRLDAPALRLSAPLTAGPGDEVLVASSDTPLVVRRSGTTPRLDTNLDFGAMADASGPDIPLLVNWLFERLLGHPLLDDTVITDRGPGAARVVPAAGGTTAVAPTLAPAGAQWLRDAGWLLLLAALLVLLWEIAALAHQWRRLRA